MAIYLNGCPVKLKRTKFSVCVLKYSDDLFKELRAKYKSVIFYRHKGIEILGFSFEQQYDSKLQEFVKDTKWCHIDIAGTAYLEKPQKEFIAGATGVGVRTLLNYITEK